MYHFRSTIQALAAVLLLFGGATKASAIPIISIDLDPAMAGIQTSLSVAPGASFTIDMVITSDGMEEFDRFAFAADFNNMGAILGLSGGTGSPTAGTIVSFPYALFFAVDINAGSTLLPGDFMVSVPSFIAPSFAGSSGTLGALNVALPFDLDPLGPMQVDLFSLTFMALSTGTSDIVPNGDNQFSFGLSMVGGPVLFFTAGATVTVMAPPGVIPVPAAIWLFGTALIGLVGFGKRKSRIAT